MLSISKQASALHTLQSTCRQWLVAFNAGSFSLAAAAPLQLTLGVAVQAAYATAARPLSEAPRGKDRSRQLSALVRYGHDLTEEARRELLDPVIGRQDVIQRTMQVLLRRTKHNPLLIGEAGVGKTAIVEGIAQLMAAPNPPSGLAGKRLVALDVAAVVAGSTYRGEFEERLQSLLHDCEAAQGSVVLFIDEIHVLVGAGNVEGGLDFANMLKPALARSQLQVIGATTLDEYRQHIETDPALSRRFQPILVEEPSPQECLLLLEGLAPRYETFHGVSLPPATLATAVAAAQRYIPERRLPDSAIDLIDEASAKVRLAAVGTSSTRAGPRKGHVDNRSGRKDGQRLQQQQQQQQQSQQVLVSQSNLDSRQASFLQEWQQTTAPSSSDPISTQVMQANTQSQQQNPQTHANPQPQQQQLGATTTSAPAVTAAAAATGAKVAPAQSWFAWITSRGWRGEAEVHRQQLLEWFGAHPHKPLKGAAGHQQTTSERRKKHEQLFGQTATASSPTSSSSSSSHSSLRPDFTGSVVTTSHAAVATAATHIPATAATSIQQQQQPLAAQGLASLSSVGPTDFSAKSCPHCGTVVLPAQGSDPVRLQCHHCGFRFLNIAPDKLQLGTTVLMDKQQAAPWPAQRQQQQVLSWQSSVQQQQQGHEQPWGLDSHSAHRISLADTPAAVAAVAAVSGGAAAAVHAPTPLKRAAVAVQQRAGDAPDQQDPVVQPWSEPPLYTASQSGLQQHQQQQQQQPNGAAIISERLQGDQAMKHYKHPAAPTPATDPTDKAGTGSTSLSSPAAGAAQEGGTAAAAAAAAALPVGADSFRSVVTPADILQVVAEATGIAQHLIVGLTAAAAAHSSPTAGHTQPWADTTTRTTLQELSVVQAALSAAVQGQDVAVAAVIGALRLSRMGLAPHHHTTTQQQLQPLAESARPSLSLMFLGPSGVGKTTMARTLAEALLPGEPAGVLVFSCGELSERHSISRLVGAPPGYVGYGKGGLLTEAIRRRPFSCVLFDDVERAHPDVVGLLLQAVEDGYLMDSLGHNINLRSTVFLFTANTNRPAVTEASSRPHSTATPHSQPPAANGASPIVPAGQHQPAGANLCGNRGASFSTLTGNALSSLSWQQQQQPAAYQTDVWSSSSSSGGSSQHMRVPGARGFFIAGGSGSEGAELEPDEVAGQHAAAEGGLSQARDRDASSTGSGGGSSRSARDPPSAGPGSARDAMMLELGSRVDELIHFQPLDDVSMTAIVQQQLQQAADQARLQGVKLQVDAAAAAWLAASGCSASQGARPLVQLIRRHVLVPLAEAVMNSIDIEASVQQLQGGSGGVAEASGAAGGTWAVATVRVSVGVQGAVPVLELQRL